MAPLFLFIYFFIPTDLQIPNFFQIENRTIISRNMATLVQQVKKFFANNS